MTLRPAFWATLLLAGLLGCSNSSDDPTGPGGDPTGPPAITSFFTTASNADVLHGEWTTLRWKVSGASAAFIEGVGPLDNPAEGSVSIRPARTQTYTLRVQNGSGISEATADVAVLYPSAHYVDAIDGDDARDGRTPDTALKSLSEALSRAPGGFIFLSGGVFDANVVLDGFSTSISGGLNPATFFEDVENYETVIRPSSGVPLSATNGFSLAEFRYVTFDAQNGGEFAVDLDNTRVDFSSCVLNGSRGSSGTAVRVNGALEVNFRSCRIYGGREFVSTTFGATRGIEIVGNGPVLVSNSFVDGGKALFESSGIDVNPSAPANIRIGLSTISAETASQIGQVSAASIRIRNGRPSVGGNILFTQGFGLRVGIFEEGPDTSPDWFERNLLISMGVPPYQNFDGDDPITQEQLNVPSYTTGNNQVGDNILVTGYSASLLFRDMQLGDYHLVDPLQTMIPNPAVNAGDTELSAVRYGGAEVDVDDTRRPGTGNQLDLGADEITP